MVQLIYASAAVKPFTKDELNTLLAKARIKNRLFGVTGILVYDAGSFLQVLEGPEDAVEPLYATIKRDPRHTNHKLLGRSTIVKGEFPDWSMGFIDRTLEVKRSAGYLDLNRALPHLTQSESQAKKMLRFFYEGLCRQRA